MTSTTDARAQLTRYIKRFREDPFSEPVVFGSHRKPEGVVMSIEMYEDLVARLEDAEIALTVRRRLAEAGDERLTLEEMLTKAGRPDLIPDQPR